MRKKILSDIYKMPAEWEKQKSLLSVGHIMKKIGQIASIIFQRFLVKSFQVFQKSQNVKVLIKEKNSKKDIVPILKRYKSKLNNIYFIVCKTDRVWLRDTGPIFLKGNRGKKILSDWKFNGWAKYKNHRNDNRVNTLIKKHYKSEIIKPHYKNKHIVLEGGAIDVNGKGLLLTTKECLLSKIQQEIPI